MLLHVDPLTRFDVIKQMLYKALQETYLRHADTKKLIPLPDSAAGIQLGRPVDVHDPSAGFRLGEWEYQLDNEAAATDAKGKGKAGTTAAPSEIQQCPKGAGLRDNAVLAFRFKGDGTEWGSRVADGDEDMEADVPSMWGVKIATFDDSYGVENEGDVGGRKDFAG